MPAPFSATIRRHVLPSLAFNLLLSSSARVQAQQQYQPRPCNNAQYSNPYVRELPISGPRVTGYSAGRPLIEGDYFVIEWNESSREAFWYDYKDRFRTYHLITRNGTFLPVVDYREKIAVHICGLHFGDQVTVTTTGLPLPEGGADIRGVAPATNTPSLSSSLDTIQNPSATGGTAPGGSLGYNATSTPNLIPTAVNGIVPGKISQRAADGTVQYTDGTVTASGTQIAIWMYETYKNAQDLKMSIESFKRHRPQKPLPGSIDAIEKEMHDLSHEIDRQRRNTPNDAATFDEDVNSTQILAADLSNLSAAIASQGFGARAIAIENNFAAMKAVLELSGYDPLGTDSTRKDFPTPLCVLPPPNKDPNTAIELANQAITIANQAKASVAKITGKPGGTPVYSPISAGRAYCDPSEQSAYSSFNTAYQNGILKLFKGNIPSDFDNFSPTSQNLIPNPIFDELTSLKKELTEIDQLAGKIFTAMNDWYRSSQVEQTDVLPAAANNSIIRVSIAVQRGYTPFTLSSSPTSVSPTATAVVATPPATVALTASTSTPAHTVKTFLLEVHRQANFNLAGGAAIFHVPTKTYSLVTQNGTATSTSNGATPPVITTTYIGSCGTNGPSSTLLSSGTTIPTYACVVQTQTTQWQPAAVVGIVWYPWRHDYFPRRAGFSTYPRNFLPSFLIATSVNTLGNALGAINWEPITGIDFFAGVGAANSTRLPDGVTTNTVLPSTYTYNPDTRYLPGFTTGIAFDLGVFNQLFSKPQGASLP